MVRNLNGMLERIGIEINTNISIVKYSFLRDYIDVGTFIISQKTLRNKLKNVTVNGYLGRFGLPYCSNNLAVQVLPCLPLEEVIECWQLFGGK